MKPMLAAATDGHGLAYPMLLSPKLDGVRCLIINGVATSRSLKPIPNRYVQKLFGQKRLNGLDGELIVGPANAGDVYRRTTSGVMSVEGKPDVTYFVFDDFSCKAMFLARLDTAGHLVRDLGLMSIQTVKHHVIDSQEELRRFEKLYLEEGYEGVMLRSMEGPYKQGRSTEKEGWLLKLKRFVDAEAEVIGFAQLLVNNNVAKRNALGNLERSSHKANKKPVPMIGALVCRDRKSGVVFDIGTGFDDADREEMWTERKELIGKLVKYKSQPTGVKDKPRFPVFLGWRNERDL